MNVHKTVLLKVKELGDKAPAYFGYSPKTIASWHKKPSSIPVKAINKALESAPSAPTASSAAPKVSAEASPPPKPTPAAYTLEAAYADAQGFFNWINNVIAPWGQAIDQRLAAIETQQKINAEAVANINAWRRQLQAPRAPTVRQAIAESDLPSLVNPARGKAQIIESFVGGGHPLDTGLAPSAEARAVGLGAIADGHNPNNPPREPGPADGSLQQGESGIGGWAKPWPHSIRQQ